MGQDATRQNNKGLDKNETRLAIDEELRAKEQGGGRIGSEQTKPNGTSYDYKSRAKTRQDRDKRLHYRPREDGKRWHLTRLCQGIHDSISQYHQTKQVTK